MENAIDSLDFDKFISIAEVLIPGFTEKLKSTLNEPSHASESDDAELLQEEQNLTDQIDDMKNTVDECTKEYDEVSKRLDDLRIQLRKLEVERENVHKKWINSHPAKHSTGKPDIRLAFSILANYFEVPESDDNYVKMFKRFDNLVHARCSNTTLFGEDFNISDVIDLLNSENALCLGQDISDFWNKCKSDKA